MPKGGQAWPPNLAAVGHLLDEFDSHWPKWANFGRIGRLGALWAGHWPKLANIGHFPPPHPSGHPSLAPLPSGIRHARESMMVATRTREGEGEAGPSNRFKNEELEAYTCNSFQVLQCLREVKESKC